VTGKTFLPFGSEDIQHYYFPTVTPVAGGGYFWLFFDGVRHYGSLGSGRQLWGTALDISADGSYTKIPAIQRSTCLDKNSAPATTARLPRSIPANKTATAV
jgi:hypothetical protein